MASMRSATMLAFLTLALPGAAAAQTPAPPYSLPFQLRPASVATAARADTSFARYEPEGASENGATVASVFTASYAVTKGLAPFLRLGLVSSTPPESLSTVAATNPVAGSGWALPLSPHWKLAGVVGVALPVGSGGGNHPDQSTRAALGAGVLARSALDNALFGVNYLTVFSGVDLAWVHDGFTVQAEVTLFEAARTRGEDVDSDSNRTNLTMGVHVAYFLLPMLSAGAELRMQRWLVSSTFLDDGAGANDENVSVALGARLHMKLSDSSWIRPGLSWARGLDDPLAANGYDTLQIDVPVTF